MEYVSGKLVEFADSANGEWKALRQGDTLRGGQCVRTSYESSALLKGNFGDQVFLMELCRVVLDPTFLRKYAGAGESVRGVQVLSGKAWLKVTQGHGSFLGKTPGGLARVKGTRFSLSYDEKKGRTQVVLEEGAVVVSQAGSGQDSVELRKGQALAWLTGEIPGKVHSAEPEELQVPAPIATGARYTPEDDSRNAATAKVSAPLLPGTDIEKAASLRLDSVANELEATIATSSAGPTPGKPHRKGAPDPIRDPRADFEAAKQEKYEAITTEKARIGDSIRSKLEKTGASGRESEAMDELDRETGP